MNDISSLDARLAAAMDRIAAAHARNRDALRAAQAEAAGPANEDAGEIAPLKAELTKKTEAVAQARAQLTELQQALEQERQNYSDLALQAEADRAARDAARDELAALQSAERLEAVREGGKAEEAQLKITRLEQALDRLRAVNAQLRQNNSALRAACAEGVTDAALVNDSLKAELDALQAARDADRAEIDSILSALKPIVEETADG